MNGWFAPIGAVSLGVRVQWFLPPRMPSLDDHGKFFMTRTFRRSWFLSFGKWLNRARAIDDLHVAVGCAGVGFTLLGLRLGIEVTWCNP